MKVEIDFIKAHATLTFEQLRDLIDEASQAGYEAGVKDSKAHDRLNKVQENTVKEVGTKPPKLSLPDNNKELLEKFLGGKILDDKEAELIRTNLGEDQYRRGFNDGVKAQMAGDAKVFNPQVHVDNSVYGYALIDEIKTMGEQKGSMKVLRSMGTKVEGRTFVKITPMGVDQ